MGRLRIPGFASPPRRRHTRSPLLLAALASVALATPFGSATAKAAPAATIAHSTTGHALRGHHGAPAVKPTTTTNPRLRGATSTTQTSKHTVSTAGVQPRALSGPGAISDLLAYGTDSAVNQALKSDTMSIAVTPSGAGAWTLQADGSVKPSGDAVYLGDGVGDYSCGDYNYIVSTGTGAGYWVVTDDGCVYTTGDAVWYGEPTDQPRGIVVAVRATSTGKGYYIVDHVGHVFTYGDAAFHGGTGNINLNSPITSMALTADGGGYWLTAADGGIFSFGSAQYYGSTGNIQVAGIIIDMAATSTGHGYWLASSEGTVYRFGDAVSHGDLSGTPTSISGIVRTADDGGYWLAGADGAIHQFGDATALNGDTAYVVGSFLGTQSTAIASDFTAVIDWGDGSSSAGQVDGTQNYVITGRHTYTRASYWRLTVHVSDSAGDNLAAWDVSLTVPTTGYWMVASDGGIFTFGEVPFPPLYEKRVGGW